MIIRFWVLFEGFGLLRRKNMIEPRCQTWVGRGRSSSTLGDRATAWARISIANVFKNVNWNFRHVTCVCRATHDRSQVASYIVLTELAVKNNGRSWIFNFSLLFTLRVFIVQTTACAAKRKWSAWKRLCKAERAAMTLEHFKERMIIFEYYNGR